MEELIKKLLAEIKIYAYDIEEFPFKGVLAIGHESTINDDLKELGDEFKMILENYLIKEKI